MSTDLYMDLEKGGGEGSRGGIVIGRTRNDKAIYLGKSPPDHYAGWHKDDHTDAHIAHVERSFYHDEQRKKHKSFNNDSEANYHKKRMEIHNHHISLHDSLGKENLKGVWKNLGEIEKKWGEHYDEHGDKDYFIKSLSKAITKPRDRSLGGLSLFMNQEQERDIVKYDMTPEPSSDTRTLDQIKEEGSRPDLDRIERLAAEGDFAQLMRYYPNIEPLDVRNHMREVMGKSLRTEPELIMEKASMFPPDLPQTTPPGHKDDPKWHALINRRARKKVVPLEEQELRTAYVIVSDNDTKVIAKLRQLYKRKNIRMMRRYYPNVQFADLRYLFGDDRYYRPLDVVLDE